MMNFKKFLLSIIFSIGIFVPMSAFATTGTIDSSSNKSKLCTNSDCSVYTIVYWTTTHGNPVSVTDNNITGDIWSESFGWIRLNPSSPPPTVAGCSSQVVQMVPTNTGTLSGCGWGSTASWVNFLPTNGGVSIDPSSGNFSGWAWVSGAGWMKFDCAGGAGSDGCVKTSWRPTTVTHTVPPPYCIPPLVGVYPDCHLPIITCTPPLVGTYPDCHSVTTSCVLPLIGTYPDCHLPTCVAPLIGTYPDCHLPTCTPPLVGTYPDCHVATTMTCAYPLVGTYPDCHVATCVGPSCGTKIIGDGGGGGIIKKTNIDPCDEKNKNGVTGTIKSGVDNSICFTKKTITKTTDTIKKILTTGEGSVITETIATVGVVAGSAITLTSTLFLNPLSFSELFLIPARLWSLLMTALGLKKRRRPWGTVYDSVTKQPIDPAYVTLKNAEGKEITSSLTDLDGRFGFVVPEPGFYTIFAQKTNYVFPSQKLVGHDHDELYRDLYFGEHFEVKEAGEVVIKNIPMDPEKFDWNEFAKREQKLMRFYSKRDKWLRLFSDIFFGFGFIVSSIAVLASPVSYNIAIFLLYVILYFMKTHGVRSRPFGDIVESGTDIPLSFCIIRISNIVTGVEVMHRIADAKGRYYALLPNGDYKVRIDKKLPDGTYQTVLSDAPAKVIAGYLATKFSV